MRLGLCVADVDLIISVVNLQVETVRIIVMRELRGLPFRGCRGSDWGNGFLAVETIGITGSGLMRLRVERVAIEPKLFVGKVSLAGRLLTACRAIFGRVILFFRSECVLLGFDRNAGRVP